MCEPPSWPPLWRPIKPDLVIGLAFGIALRRVGAVLSADSSVRAFDRLQVARAHPHPARRRRQPRVKSGFRDH